jgi:hypothetical protein
MAYAGAECPQPDSSGINHTPASVQNLNDVADDFG